MSGFDPVRWAIPAFIVLVLVEMAWARRYARDAYEPRDTTTSLLLGLGNTVAAALTAGLVLAAAEWLSAFRLATLGWGWWASCKGCEFRAWSGNSRAQAVEAAREHRAAVKTLSQSVED